MTTLNPVQTTIDNGQVVDSLISPSENVTLYVNGSTGNDANNGYDEANALATVQGALDRVSGFKRLWEILLDADGVGRTYTLPTEPSSPSGSPASAYGGAPRGTGVRGSALVINSKAVQQLVAEQTDAIGGYNFALNGTFPNTTIAVDPGAAGTSIDLVDASLLPTVGMVLIETELVRYTGKTGNTLTGCTRGYCNTTGAAHAIGVSVLLRLDGYWAQITEAAVSTTLSAGISATDTTIPLTSAASFATPSAATGIQGFAKIGSEIIAYTAKSGNNLTGCLRGYNNTVAAAYAGGTTVQGGANLLQVRQIKYNTASLCVIVDTFPSAIAVGSKFVVERTATKIDAKGWTCPDSDVVLRNVKIYNDVGQFDMVRSGVRIARCEFEHVGNFQIAHSAGAWLSTIAGAGLGIFGSQNPVPEFENSSGFRCERIGTSGNTFISHNAMVVGRMVFVNCVINFSEAAATLIGGTLMNTLGGSLTIQDSCNYVNNVQVPLGTGRQLFNRTAIINDRGSVMRLRACDIVFPPGATSAVLNRTAGSVVLDNVGGVGAARYGLEMLDGWANALAGVNSPLTADPGTGGTTISLTSAASFGTPAAGSFLTVQIENEIIFYTGKAGNDLTGCIRGMQGTVAAAHLAGTTAEQGNCLKGTLGGMKVGSRPVRTWADYHATSPASGLPSRNEFDVPAFGARPFKLTFAGMAAADAIDITAQGAFATPAGATATVPSIWEGTPPAIANASTLRVTAGAAAFVGNYALTDAAGTLLSPATDTVVGTAQLSDDGKTITFPVGAQVTAMVVEYIPVSGAATGARVAA